MKGALTDGPPFRRLLAFGFPLVVGSIAHALFNLVDVWLVGRFAPLDTNGDLVEGGREAALAAIHASSVLNFLPMLLANGISVATIATVSRAVGASDRQRAADGVNRSLVISLVIGAFVGILSGVFAKQQIDALEVAAEAHATAVRCLEILSYGSVTMFALLQVTAVERATGHTLPPLVVLTGANLMNAGVAFYAIPRWGAEGAAWATVLCRGFFAIVGIVWLYARVPEIRKPLGKLRDLYIEALDLLRLGIPASLQIFSRAVAVIFITRLISKGSAGEPDRESTDVTAAYSVALRLEMIAMFACAGWGSAAAAAVGQNLGAGNVKRAIRMGWIGALVAGVAMIALGAAFYLLAPRLFPFFIEEDQAPRLDAIVGYGTEYFRIVAFSYAAVGVGIVLAEALNGAGATRTSFTIDFVAYVGVLLGLAIWLNGIYGRAGLWYALLIVHIAVALAYALCYARVIHSRARAAT
ncbi:MAG: MATE family efflux transporter [Planctomycetota bacterium]